MWTIRVSRRTELKIDAASRDQTPKPKMEFQVYDVILEDRPPKALVGNKEDGILMDDWWDDENALSAPLDRDTTGGCMAFVFGRNADGQSVCARLDGVRPKLFFQMKEGDTLARLKVELEQEVRSARDNQPVLVRIVRMCHFGSYEPCLLYTSPSPRD